MLIRNIDYASKQLNKIRNRISAAVQSASREESEVTLIGAAKKQSAGLCDEFCRAGLRAIGENFLQEGVARQQAMTQQDIQWHYIGRIQSNKTRPIAQHFDWVHSVDRLKIAQRFSAQNEGQELQLLIQLNVDDETTKAGVELSKAAELCAQIAELNEVQLRGFMVIPQPQSEFSEQRKPFALAREALEQANQRYGLNLDSLSMGMSNDLEAAIAEGSTMLRIGTDLFGPRITDE
ncbi:MAG: YggS family pyridoxal phosphate-dependent enzyme [Arenicella sp.]|nr:YggS family pyridoxal phosphate-dependent enzyme [Arenicella sp.]